MGVAGQLVVAMIAESAEAEPMLGHARDTLNALGVPFVEATIVGRAGLRETIAGFEAAGAGVVIVANTSSDPLSAAVAGMTLRPVLGVPLEAPGLGPLESLRATTSPGGSPVGALAIGKAGSINAALLAAAILANVDVGLRERLERFRAEQTAKVLADRLE